MITLVLSVAIGACSPPRSGEAFLLVVTSSDRALRSQDAALAIEQAIRSGAAGILNVLPAEATEKALTVEGGEEAREKSLVDARVIVNRAEERFRELDDEESLALLASATAKLTGVHQQPGAVEILARAHLLAGSIYLARGRVEAARQRIQRALDLDPDLAPPRDRFAPEVLAEVAAVRGAQATRPSGRLVIESPEGASVFVDGRLRGRAPLEIDSLGAGTHVLRFSAPGFESRVETLSIAAAEERRLSPELAPDPEIKAISELPDRLSRGEDVSLVLDLLARRGGAERTLVARAVIASELTSAGTSTAGAYLSARGLGIAFAPGLEREVVSKALRRMLACADESGAGPKEAPSILGLGPVRATALEPVPEPKPWWASTWFFAAFAAVALGGGAAFVLARKAGGPPQAVEVTLIPRP